MTDNTLPLDKLTLKHWAGISLVILGVVMFFIVNTYIAPLLNISPFENEAINHIFRYQVTMLAVTFVFLAGFYALFADKFRVFARLGNLRATPEPVRWLDIKVHETWLKVGINFTVIVSVATGAFMFFGSLEADLNRLNLSYAGLALVFALSNSFIEEMITRFGVVVSLHDVLPAQQIAVLSGLVFCIPHYFGTPGGPIGVIMAGFLGWFLAKSIMETRGIFWAWLVHFVQDVIIFTVLMSVLPV